MKRLFGTDGMRGPAGQFPLDAPTVFDVGLSLAKHLAEKADGRVPRIVVGRDTRESGALLESAIIAGATKGGAICETAGVITTPGVAFLTRSLPADAGVVISASHNPYQDNGIKIFAPTGKKLDDATERQIESDILESHRGGARSWGTSGVEYEKSRQHAQELREAYLTYLEDEVSGSLKLAGLKMVIDCANGAASSLAPELFKRLGATVIAINNAPDGKNINLGCGSLHLEGLQQRVVEEKATFGVAYDGDADRALFVDSSGQIVDGDATLWVLAQYFASKGELEKDLVVATVMSNIGLEKALDSRGWKLVRTDVGDKYVLEELLQTGASIGGEQSGHIIFPRLSLAGDGMMTTISILRAISESGRQLHELVDGFRRYPQTLLNIRVAEKLPFDQVPAIAEASRRTEYLLHGNGRLLLRYSGTEPLARVMIEGIDQAEIEKMAQDLGAVIKQALG
jgi:phosphoglucosamine mutase